MTESSPRKFLRSLLGVKPAGHGPYHEGNDGWVDAKPYTAVYNNGIFEGYNGDLWMYFRLPQDVQVEWLSNPDDAVRNQHFFLNLLDHLGQLVNDQVERTRNDIRRDFHLQITQELFSGIEPYPGCTEAHADYLKRMSEQIGYKPVWYGYLGVKLQPSSIFHETYGMKAKMERYFDVMRNPAGLQAEVYRQEIHDMERLMADNGFSRLDFDPDNPSGMEDYRRLTAWHGQEDEAYGLPRQLEYTRMQEPLHGQSLIVPRWGEICFHAVKPEDNLFMVDPASSAARWGQTLYHPGNNVVAISIKGQVRASRVAQSLMDSKHSRKVDAQQKRRERDGGRSTIADEEDIEDQGRLERARSSVNNGRALLDNVEIVVATAVTGNRNTLPQALSAHGLTSGPIVNRQPQALMSTLPAYPKPIFKVPRGNGTRSPLSNQMLGGALAFSGIFRHTRPAEREGFIVGLSNAGYEYQEIMTSVDAANKYHRVPGFLVTGRPGAGKTQQILQCSHQLTYQGYGLFFLNPKPESSLQPVFDHLGGVTINMSRRYLEENPGLLDPMFFLGDDPIGRQEVAQRLSGAIIMAMSMYGAVDQTRGAQERTRLSSEILDNAKDTRNKCSYDIIFGNDQTGTTGIGGQRDQSGKLVVPNESDRQIRSFVAERMKVSPFWQALISRTHGGSHLQSQLALDKPVLVEWDGSLSLPTVDQNPDRYNDEQVDSILSVSLVFQYAVKRLGQGRQGGALIVDEAWVLRRSPEAMSILNRGAREWRQLNIMLMLSTQNITDFMSEGEDDMTQFFDRYLFMAINDSEAEFRKFFDITDLPDTEANREYMKNAGVDSQGKSGAMTPPKGYYLDKISDWHGGIICGPWPELELSLGRTDVEGERQRASAMDDRQHEALDHDIMYGGMMRNIVNQDLIEYES